MFRDLPGGPMVKNPRSNAGDVGSIPGQGTKIPHATGATKPMHRPHPETKTQCSQKNPKKTKQKPLTFKWPLLLMTRQN